MQKLDAKTISEIASNWAQVVALTTGLILAAAKGPGLIDQKENEIALRSDALIVETAKQKLQLSDEIEKSISALQSKYEQEHSKPREQQNHAVLDELEKSLESKENEQLRILKDVKSLIQQTDK